MQNFTALLSFSNHVSYSDNADFQVGRASLISKQFIAAFALVSFANGDVES